MNERLLQYIWQFQYFNAADLVTTSGEQLVILDQGMYNRNQGPDFLHARIRLSNQVWVGNIELHISENDWYVHRHHQDRNYDNVVLHVVYYRKQDSRISSDGQERDIPTLSLEGRISHLLMDQYSRWMNNSEFIPCGNRLHQIKELIWAKWKERLVVERFNGRLIMLKEWLIRNRFHWEEALWWSIARSFGTVINSDAFLSVAMSIPYTILMRHRGNLRQVEALMFGQAGLLNPDFKDEYAVQLWREYSFLKEKYSMHEAGIRMHFLRMRPPSFPTMRLAQLSMVFHSCPSIFNSVMYCSELSEIRKIFSVVASGYWHSHYVFDEASSDVAAKPGKQLINVVIVNGILPFLFTYGEHHADEKFISRALEWLKLIPAESDGVMKSFAKAGVKNDNAFDSQALHQLKKSYCEKKRCLDCSIGAALLSGSDCAGQETAAFHL